MPFAIYLFFSIFAMAKMSKMAKKISPFFPFSPSIFRHFCHSRHQFSRHFCHYGENGKNGEKNYRNFSPFLLFFPKNRWRNGNEPPPSLCNLYITPLSSFLSSLYHFSMIEIAMLQFILLNVTSWEWNSFCYRKARRRILDARLSQ